MYNPVPPRGYLSCTLGVILVITKLPTWECINRTKLPYLIPPRPGVFQNSEHFWISERQYKANSIYFVLFPIRVWGSIEHMNIYTKRL